MNDRGRESRDATGHEPTPPAIAAARRYLLMTAASAMFGVVAALLLPPVSALFFVFAALFGWAAWVVGADARAFQLTRFALQALTRGDTEAVHAYHARIPERAKRRGLVARAVSYQRALLALYRSAPAEAIAELGPALAPRTRLHSRTMERMQRAVALSLRALCHAMLGEDAAAAADAREAETIPEAGTDAIARVELARAVVLARGRRREELRGLLARRGNVLLEFTMPRERGLTRALRTYARAEARSVYREPAKREEEGAQGMTANWIGNLVPEAAAYTREDLSVGVRSAPAAMPAPTEAAMTEVAAARREASTSARGSTRWKLMIAVGTVLISGLAAFLVITAASAPGSPSPISLGGPVGIGFLLLTAALALVAIVRTRSAARLNLELFGARRALAAGDNEAANRIYERLATRGTVLFRAFGHAGLAILAERQASFERSVDECTRSIALISSSSAIRAAASDQLLPSILGTRAVALAALDKTEQALAELALMRSHHPSFVHLDSMHLRVRLLCAVRSGDLTAARVVARERTLDSPLRWPDDILCDLVLATEPGGLPKSERERVAAELADDASIRRWIDAVAPGLREAFVREAAHGPRVVTIVEESAPPILDELEDSAECQEQLRQTS